MASRLTLESVVGFGGDVVGGLLVHHAGFLLYPLGSTIVIRQIGDASSQEFLQVSSGGPGRGPGRSGEAG